MTRCSYLLRVLHHCPAQQEPSDIRQRAPCKRCDQTCMFVYGSIPYHTLLSASFHFLFSLLCLVTMFNAVFLTLLSTLHSISQLLAQLWSFPWQSSGLQFGNAGPDNVGSYAYNGVYPRVVWRLLHPDYIGRASYKIYELTESEPVRVGPCSLHFNRLSRSFLCELCFTSNAVSLMGSLGISVIFVFLCTDTPHVRAPGLIWIYHYSVPLVCLTAGYLYCWGLLENHILRVTTCPSQSQM